MGGGFFSVPTVLKELAAERLRARVGADASQNRV